MLPYTSGCQVSGTRLTRKSNQVYPVIRPYSLVALNCLLDVLTCIHWFDFHVNSGGRQARLSYPHIVSGILAQVPSKWQWQDSNPAYSFSSQGAPNVFLEVVGVEKNRVCSCPQNAPSWQERQTGMQRWCSDKPLGGSVQGGLGSSKEWPVDQPGDGGIQRRLLGAGSH